MDSIEILKKLINKRKYKEAEEVAKKNQMLKDLIKLLSNNKYAKEAAMILKRNKISLDEYPELLDRLRKRYVRYVMQKTKYDQAEIRFLSNKHCLSILAEDLCYKKQINESLSIVKRHGLQTYVAKEELIELLNSDYEYVENIYLTLDGFGYLISAYGKFD